jgi:hypothetical protein
MAEKEKLRDLHYMSARNADGTSGTRRNLVMPRSPKRWYIVGIGFSAGSWESLWRQTSLLFLADCFLIFSLARLHLFFGQVSFRPFRYPERASHLLSREKAPWLTHRIFFGVDPCYKL